METGADGKAPLSIKQILSYEWVF